MPTIFSVSVSFKTCKQTQFLTEKMNTQDQAQWNGKDKKNT